MEGLSHLSLLIPLLRVRIYSWHSHFMSIKKRTLASILLRSSLSLCQALRGRYRVKIIVFSRSSMTSEFSIIGNELETFRSWEARLNP